MTRDATPYASRDARQVNVAGSTSIAEPVAGFYRCRLRSGSVIGGVRLWFGQPADPLTGELMDRSLRWMAEFDGEPVEFDRVWPTCAGSPITETEYRALVARREWAKQHAPESAYAQPGKRIDLLSTSNPMPF